MKSLKKIASNVGMSLLVTVCIALLSTYAFGDLVDWLENVSYYFRYSLKFSGNEKSISADPPEYGIEIVDIDDMSMEKMGKYWSWDRSVQARMVDTLSGHFPAAIAFDVLFYDREDKKHQERLENIFSRVTGGNPQITGVSVHDQLMSAIDYDEQFARSIRKSGRVFMGLCLADESDYGFTSQIAHRMDMAWHESLNPASALIFPRDITATIIDKKTIVDGIYPDLAQGARQIGHVNVIDVGQDGVIKEIPLLYRFGNFDPVYLPLSIRTVATLFGTPNEEIKLKPEQYLDIGKPFKVFKNRKGDLRYSYPDVTSAQIRAILNSKDEIFALKDKEKLDITSFLVMEKDQLGRICLVLRASSSPLPFELSEALLEKDEELLNLEVGSELTLPEDYTVSRGSDYEWYVLMPDGIEIMLTEQELRTIALLKPEDLPMGSSERKLLFFDFWVKRQNGVLVSSLPVLRGATLTELLETGWGGLQSMERDSRRDFGKTVQIPLRKGNRHLVTYFGKASKPFPYNHFYDIVNNRIQSAMEGKIFLVGSTSASLFDIKPVPHDKQFPAVEIHASLMNSLLTDTFVKRLPPWMDLAVLLAVGLIIALMAFFLKPLWSGLFLAGFIFAYLLACMVVFENFLWIEMVRPVITIILSFTAVMGFRYMTEEKDRKFLQSTFKQYLSPELIDIMYTQKQRPQLGGEEGIRTAYFTDIQGFSTFSEKLGSPTKLVELLNEYLSAMTDILLSHYGTLDKYEGDAIIAFFGAPVPMADHAIQACQTALDMQTALGELRKKWFSEGEKWPQIVHNMRMRIGINTGAITTGNMGSAVRMNYTMMGDAVNLAARLESAAKQYGVYTMISHYTYNMIREQFSARQLDKIRVVGKSEPVVIYELLGRKGELDPALSSLMDIYSSALEHFYSRQWQKAEELLTRAHEMEPNRTVSPSGVTPSLRLLELTREYKINPPGPDWDGVRGLTSK